MIIKGLAIRLNAVPPPGPAERLLVAVAMGQLGAAAMIFIVVSQLVDPEIPYAELAPYPVWSALVGLAFIVLGTQYWGRLYLTGVACIVASPLMARYLLAAPLILGAIIGVTHLGAGLNLRRLGRDGES
jgi:hypothetical protein